MFEMYHLYLNTLSCDFFLFHTLLHAVLSPPHNFRAANGPIPFLLHRISCQRFLFVIDITQSFLFLFRPCRRQLNLLVL